jgi:hypothetical protein
MSSDDHYYYNNDLERREQRDKARGLIGDTGYIPQCETTTEFRKMRSSKTLDLLNSIGWQVALWTSKDYEDLLKFISGYTGKSIEALRRMDDGK